jgi:hypothetical protein
MPVSEAQKRANQKWRQSNRDKSRLLTSKHMKISRNKWYDYNNEVKKFRKILFDGFIQIE